MSAHRNPHRALAMLAASAALVIGGCGDEAEVPNPARANDRALLNESEVVFVGTILSTEELATGETRAVVEVTDVLKGEVSGDVVDVVAPEGIQVTDLERFREAGDTDEKVAGLWFATGADPYLLVTGSDRGNPIPGDEMPDYFRRLIQTLDDTPP